MGLDIPQENRQYPARQTAVVCGPNREFLIEKDYPTIHLEDEHIIVRTVISPLNPVDTKMLGDFGVPGNIHGLDTAGIVVAIGPKVTRDFKIGDKVAGCCEIMNKDRPLGGSFAEYVSMHANLALKVPDHLALENASALGTPIASAVDTIFNSFGLPSEWLKNPTDKPFPVLVYGGSTASGTMMIQFLKICGLQVLTTCSPRNFELVKSYGADEVFDYNSPDCAADIKAFTKNCLGYAIDCITSSSSMEICYKSIGRAGGKYTALDPFPETGATRKVVKPDWIIATVLMGHEIYWPAPFGRPARPELLYEFVPPVYAMVNDLVMEGRIKPHPVKVMDGGFEGLVEGVNKIRRGEVSGYKLAYKISEP